MKPLNVVSLFNGMSTGHKALVDLGITVGKYYSSEIKKFANKLTQHHFPNTIQLGDIRNWKQWDVDWSSIDLLLSGSPCKDLSIAGKRKGINGDNSGLFWVFIEILNYIKTVNPNILFFQENVGSASKEDIRIMSEAMGILPVKYNSSLLTAQLRDRYYWSNIRVRTDWTGYYWTDLPKPKDKYIMFKDIITSGYTNRNKCTSLLERQSTSAAYKDMNSEIAQKYLKSRAKMKIMPVVYEIDCDLLYEFNGELRVKTNTVKGYDVMTENDCLNLSFPSSTTRRSRVTKGKSPCLIEVNEPLYLIDGFILRLLNKIELCRLQGFPDDYCDILSRNHTASLVGDGWTLPMITHFFSFIPEAIESINKSNK